MAETCCEMTHSHLMKWQMAKLMMANWAHLLLCNLKQIHIIRFTMHNTNSFTFTNYVKIYTQVQVWRLDIGWLEWVAPDSASTTSALSMTYSTPALLVRADQGVFFVSFSFSFWVHLAQLKHPWTSLEPWLILQVQNQRPPTFLFWPQAGPAHLSYFGALAPDSPLTTDLRSHTCWHIFSHSFLALPASCARQSHWWQRSFMSCNISSACVMKAVAMAEQTGPPKATGEGEWPGSRKGIGTRRGSLLNFAKNLSFLSLSLLLLLGLLYL